MWLCFSIAHSNCLKFELYVCSVHIFFFDVAASQFLYFIFFVFFFFFFFSNSISLAQIIEWSLFVVCCLAFLCIPTKHKCKRKLAHIYMQWTSVSLLSKFCFFCVRSDFPRIPSISFFFIFMISNAIWLIHSILIMHILYTYAK